MIAKFVVRLLTEGGDLLAWSEVTAESKPQGRPRSTPFHAVTPTRFVIERDGIATQLAVHWADLDVARLTPLMERTPVHVGQVLMFTWIEPVWLVSGSTMLVPLPPVTERAPVRIGIPVGGLGVVAPT